MKDLKIIVTHKELKFHPLHGWLVYEEPENRQVNIYFNKDIYIIQSPTGYQYEDIDAVKEFQIQFQDVMESSLYRPMCNMLYKEIELKLYQLLYKYYNIGCLVFEIYKDIECLKIAKQEGFEELE